jgi:hypothetical protein
MQTELQAIHSLCTQFAAASRAMVRDPRGWNLHLGPHGVILIQTEADKPAPWPILVHNVHCYGVDNAVLVLSDALRKARPPVPAPPPARSGPEITYGYERIGVCNYVVRPIGALGTHGFIDGVGWEAVFCDDARSARKWVARKQLGVIHKPK